MRIVADRLGIRGQIQIDTIQCARLFFHSQISQDQVEMMTGIERRDASGERLWVFCDGLFEGYTRGAFGKRDRPIYRSNHTRLNFIGAIVRSGFN